MNKIVTYSTSEIICPHCGYKYDYCNEYGIGFDDTCEECGGKFKIWIDYEPQIRTTVIGDMVPPEGTE